MIKNIKTLTHPFLVLLFIVQFISCKEEVIEINVLDSEIIFTHSELFNDIAFSNSSNGVVSGNNGSLFHTINGGATWVDVISGDNDFDYFDVHFVSDSVGFVRVLGSITNNGILKTLDGGATWTNIFQPNGGDYLKQVQFVTEDLGFCIL